MSVSESDWYRTDEMATLQSQNQSLQQELRRPREEVALLRASATPTEASEVGAGPGTGQDAA